MLFLSLSRCYTRLFSTQSLSFDKKTFLSLLQTCSHPHQLHQIHALLLTSGLSHKNSLLTFLLSTFAQWGHMDYAHLLFQQMHKPRPFIWNTLIRSYYKTHLFSHALSLYDQMHVSNVRPDEFTFPFVLKACAGLIAQREGSQVHALIIKYGFDSEDIVQTELIIMYVRFGELDFAERMFERIPKRDLISWNALIGALAQNGHANKALGIYTYMLSTREVKPDSLTLVSALTCCAQLGSFEIGQEIVQYIRSHNFESNVYINNAIMDMYGKCGDVKSARKMFNKMDHRNVVSWSTMIGAYSMNGWSMEALSLFSDMRKTDVVPNYVTFLGILNACSRGGLVKEGMEHFDLMTKDYRIEPRLEHFACMVDLLGRSGHLYEAYDFIKSMSMKPDSGVFGALLNACVIHRDIELAQIIADLLFDLEPMVASYYVLLSNVYAQAKRWSDVEKVRRRMREKGLKKVAAYSSIEWDGNVHLFYGGDKSHPQSKKIYEVLEKLGEKMRNAGYMPKTEVVLHDVEDEEKEVALGHHSEKLAMAFGLINLSSKEPIRVIKNLRICDDCHSAAKFISKIEGREIILRDKNRFHHFVNGLCSCKDFW